MNTSAMRLGVVPTWHEQANCDGLGDAMFPDAGEHAAIAYAKRVCATCPVRPECLQDALARDDQWGVRGGMTPKERRALKKAPRGASIEPIHQRARTRPGPADHHKTIAAMLGRPTPATWAEIGEAIGFSGNSVKKYWHRQRHAAAALEVAA